MQTPVIPETALLGPLSALMRRSGFYIVPLFYAREQWIAYSNKLEHPKDIPLFGVTIDNWWQKEP